MPPATPTTPPPDGIAVSPPGAVAWDDAATRRWHAGMWGRGWWTALGCGVLVAASAPVGLPGLAYAAIAILALPVWALILRRRGRNLRRHPWVPYLATVITDGGEGNGIVELRSAPDALPLRFELRPGPWHERFAAGQRALVCGDERTWKPLLAVEGGSRAFVPVTPTRSQRPGWTELGRAEHEVSADVAAALEAVAAGTVTARVAWRAAADPARHARGVVPEIGARPWRVGGHDDHGLGRALDLEYHQGRIVVDTRVPPDAHAGDATDQPVAWGEGAPLRLRIARLAAADDWETRLPVAGEHDDLVPAARHRRRDRV